MPEQEPKIHFLELRLDDESEPVTLYEVYKAIEALQKDLDPTYFPFLRLYYEQ